MWELCINRLCRTSRVISYMLICKPQPVIVIIVVFYAYTLACIVFIINLLDLYSHISSFYSPVGNYSVLLLKNILLKFVLY